MYKATVTKNSDTYVYSNNKQKIQILFYSEDLNCSKNSSKGLTCNANCSKLRNAG